MRAPITNPTGILVERDELTSLLKHLDRVTLMNTPTARRARKRGRRSSVWQNWTPKRRLGSEQKKGPSTKCRVCASGKRRTKTSSGGGLIWKGDCAPARCHPCWKVTSRNT